MRLAGAQRADRLLVLLENIARLGVGSAVAGVLGRSEGAHVHLDEPELVVQPQAGVRPHREDGSLSADLPEGVAGRAAEEVDIGRGNQPCGSQMTSIGDGAAGQLHRVAVKGPHQQLSSASLLEGVGKAFDGLGVVLREMARIVGDPAGIRLTRQIQLTLLHRLLDFIAETTRGDGGSRESDFRLAPGPLEHLIRAVFRGKPAPEGLQGGLGVVGPGLVVLPLHPLLAGTAA